ncbi:MAG: hypothetical protein KAI22_03590 [Gammaproteobacteria bacterium]|nr:hypothetical protein [Gammaproteobacteria bacterium]
MKNKNSLKRMTQNYLLFALILLLLPSFASAEVQATTTSLQDIKVQKSPLQQRGSQLLKPQNIRPLSTSTEITAESLRDAKVKKSPLQKQGITLLDPQNTRPVLRSAEITDLKIGTESDGRWYWETTIKNTGNVALDGQDVIVQGYQLSSPQGSWIGASGSRLGIGNFSPNQSRIIKMHWGRCCRTDQLKVDLLYEVSNLVLDTENLPNLLYSPGTLHMPYNIQTKQIEWNDTTKSWRTTLKNYSNYTIKLIVQGFLQNSSDWAKIPVGVSLITLGPNGEASSMWKNAEGAQPGDNLIVRSRLDMSGNNCNETSNDCRQNQMIITIPNYSHTFSINPF